MGTRGIIGVVQDGVMKGSYNQYDMYPTGVGRDLQKELDGVGFEEISRRARKMRWVNEDATPTAAERKKYAEYFENVSTGKDWYSLLRDQQGSLMKRLRAGIATDGTEFAKDSLFCEWGYIFDCDTEKVVILKGFNVDARDQYEHCVKDMTDWAAEYVGEKPYCGCRQLWTGTLDEFWALDMETLE